MGAEFTSQCDIRLASPNAKFAWNFVHRGLVPDTGAGTWLLPRIIGLQPALRLLYTGAMIDADRGRAARLPQRDRAGRRAAGPSPRAGAHHRRRLAAQPEARQAARVCGPHRTGRRAHGPAHRRRWPRASPATTTARAWPASWNDDRRSSPARDRRSQTSRATSSRSHRPPCRSRWWPSGRMPSSASKVRPNSSRPSVTRTCASSPPTARSW